MQYVLVIISLLVLANAFLISSSADSVMQQIVGYLGYVADAVLFSSGCLLGAVYRLADTIDEANKQDSDKPLQTAKVDYMTYLKQKAESKL